MKKKGIITAIIIILLLILGIGYALNRDSLKSDSYDEEWMIGKTRREIEERYGKFDAYEDLSAYPEVGRYILTEDSRSIFGEIKYGMHLRVYFDESGKAYSTQIENNGIGG